MKNSRILSLTGSAEKNERAITKKLAAGTIPDANGDGVIVDWLGDGYCDDGAFGFDFVCDDYGNDCGKDKDLFC